MTKVETIVFLSLVLDLFAFTIPLPLFPRLIEWYTLVCQFIRGECIPDSETYLRQREGSTSGLLSGTLKSVSFVRGLFYNPSAHSQKWDVVLLG